MQTIEEIKKAINLLHPKEYTKLRTWFTEKDWEKWDKQIIEDSKTGKLDFLVEEALDAKKQGYLEEL